jgi:cell division protein FtsI/penicillin-binding protein 2
MASAYAVIANGGTLYKPQTVDHIETPDFRVTHRFLPKAARWSFDPQAFVASMDNDNDDDQLQTEQALVEPVEEFVVGEGPKVLQPWRAEILREVGLTPAQIAAIHSGLVAVTSEPGGTAYWRRSRLVSMAGKTGTAQVVRLGSKRLLAEEVDYFHRDHAWFVAYAPAEDPEIVVAVLNEHSGHGGSQAAPIAVAVIDAYFNMQQHHKHPWPMAQVGSLSPAKPLLGESD